MALRFDVSKVAPDDVDAVAVPVSSDGLDEVEIDRAFLDAQGFEGKVGQLCVVGTPQGPDLVAVGVGSQQDLTPDVIRRAAAAVARSSRRRTSVASRLLDAVGEDGDIAAAAQAHAEGMSLGTYRFRRYKSDGLDGADEDRLERAVIVSARSPKRAREAVELGVRIADGVALARDLVNTPGGDLTPQALAEVAVDIAEREDLQITVMDESDIVELGLGGLLGVNRGSTNPPRFIELCYTPPDARRTLSLVGKGITFDSGGLSIKTGEGMMTMKMDMGGAAAILGAFSAINAVKPSCNVRGYIPSTDNMSGGDATRPGDVLKIRNGKTVEVLNTDAEGRLILADALSLASEGKPDAILDLATLTGAVEVALGGRIAGLMGNEDSWIAQVQAAAERAGERVWPLPLPADYHRTIESDVADLRNIGKSKGAGTIVAGLFLQDFVAEGIPWAHLDIAGTAWWGEGDKEDLSAGGTGWGVRTILELARTFKRPR